MLKINMPSCDLASLHNLRANPHPIVQDKALAVLMHSQNIKTNAIATVLDCCDNTVRNYLHEYENSGIDGISKIKFNKPKSELDSYADNFKQIFAENPPSTIAQATSIIKEHTGIELSHPQVRRFMKSIGLKCRKTAAIPAKANVKTQEDCIENQLKPAIKEAEEGKIKLFFLDSAHFVHGVFLAYIWSFVRMFIKAPSGRKRYNILGALNAITKQIEVITNETYINSSTICEMLKKLRDLSGTLPIKIVLDNARYQRCFLVQTLAETLNIQLLFIPPYSPNLNIIERYWKYVKKSCLNNKYYEKFSAFKEAIDICLNRSNTDLKMQAEMRKLLTLNFQSFEEAKVTDCAA